MVDTIIKLRKLLEISRARLFYVPLLRIRYDISSYANAPAPSVATVISRGRLSHLSVAVGKVAHRTAPHVLNA